MNRDSKFLKIINTKLTVPKVRLKVPKIKAHHLNEVQNPKLYATCFDTIFYCNATLFRRCPIGLPNVRRRAYASFQPP